MHRHYGVPAKKPWPVAKACKYGSLTRINIEDTWCSILSTSVVIRDTARAGNAKDPGLTGAITVEIGPRKSGLTFMDRRHDEA